MGSQYVSVGEDVMYDMEIRKSGRLGERGEVHEKMFELAY